MFVERLELAMADSMSEILAGFGGDGLKLGDRLNNVADCVNVRNICPFDFILTTQNLASLFVIIDPAVIDLQCRGIRVSADCDENSVDFERLRRAVDDKGDLFATGIKQFDCLYRSLGHQGDA